MEQAIEYSKNHFLNSFWIKLIAFLFMTFDHVGVFLVMYAGNNEVMATIGFIFRCIGRIALPLFIFLMVEGVRHTRNYGKYALRLGIVTAAVMLAQIIIYYFVDSSISAAYSPLVDILVCSLVIYLINRKDKFSWFAILPIIYILFCFALRVYESANPNVTVKWFPFYIVSGYNLYALLLALGIYFSAPLARKLLKSINQVEGTAYHRTVLNTCMAVSILFVTLICYLIQLIPNCYVLSPKNVDICWSIIALLFVLPYNGQRGYNKAWFKYGSYLYFPLHLIIIFAIFAIIFH